MTTQSIDSRPPKRDCRGKYVNNDELIGQWLEDLEENEEFSDIDDSVKDPNYPENDGLLDTHAGQNEEIAQSSDSDFDTEDEQPLETLVVQGRDQVSPNYTGKDGFLWSKTEIARTSRTPAHNIIDLSCSREQVDFISYEGLWSKIFDPEMLEMVILHTNKKLEAYRQQFRDTNRHELKDTNETEMRSLFGLLHYSSVFKCNDADANYLFATDGTGHEIFRCVMSKYRFCTLLNCLRFDNGADRQERLKSDRLAAISWLFNKFIRNSQQNYIPGVNICIDEMLIPFRGRCQFVMYMPNKPAKYGIKVLVLSDAEAHYTYNAYIYCGKGSDGEGLSAEEKRLGVPTQSVLKLAKPIENSNRNITADNWFSSIPLMQTLKDKKLTYLGTLKKIKERFHQNSCPIKIENLAVLYMDLPKTLRSSPTCQRKIRLSF